MLLSLLLGHTHVARHRALMHQAPSSQPSGARGRGWAQATSARCRAALRALHFERPLGLRPGKLPLLVQAAVPLGLCGCAILIAIGLVSISLKMRIVGLVGAMLGEHAVTDWSVVSIASVISSVAQRCPPFWAHTLQIVFYLTVVVMPLLWIGAALALWLTPLRPCHLCRGLALVEMCGAWAMLDVFVVIMLTSLLSLDQFAQYTLGDECVPINSLLSSYPKLRGLVPVEPVCLGVQPSLLPAFWMLFTGAVGAIPLCLLVCEAAHRALAQQRRHEASAVMSERRGGTKAARSLLGLSAFAE